MVRNFVYLPYCNKPFIDNTDGRESQPQLGIMECLVKTLEVIVVIRTSILSHKSHIALVFLIAGLLLGILLITSLFSENSPPIRIIFSKEGNINVRSNPPFLYANKKHLVEEHFVTSPTCPFMQRRQYSRIALFLSRGDCFPLPVLKGCKEHDSNGHPVTSPGCHPEQSRHFLCIDALRLRFLS